MSMVQVQPTLRSKISILLASTRMRLITISRYRGQLAIDIFIPIVLASMPILLGRATAGDMAAENFQANTGTANYVAYMLIGSSVFTVVSYAFWHVGYWLRWEQETGTLEALYLAPTGRHWLIGGVAVYSAARSLFSALTAYFLGSLFFGINPFTGEFLLALGFILIGLVPVFGLTFIFGALILKIKEANALVNLMQWGISLLMGVYFPIAVLPPLLRAIAYVFPPTWILNGVRSAMLGMEYFFAEWYWDFAVLWGFLLITPLLGYWIFSNTEHSIRSHEGAGQF